MTMPYESQTNKYSTNDHLAYNDFFTWIVYSRKCQKMPITSSQNQKLCLQVIYLYDQQSKNQKYSIYDYIKQQKAANPHHGQAGSRDYLAFLLDELLK